MLNNFFFEVFFHFAFAFLCSVFDLFLLGLYDLCMFWNNSFVCLCYAFLCF